jgi:hypothetical protein
VDKILYEVDRKDGLPGNCRHSFVKRAIIDSFYCFCNSSLFQIQSITVQIYNFLGFHLELNWYLEIGVALVTNDCNYVWSFGNFQISD